MSLTTTDLDAVRQLIRDEQVLPASLEGHSCTACNPHDREPIEVKKDPLWWRGIKLFGQLIVIAGAVFAAATFVFKTNVAAAAEQQVVKEYVNAKIAEIRVSNEKLEERNKQRYAETLALIHANALQLSTLAEKTEQLEKRMDRRRRGDTP